MRVVTLLPNPTEILLGEKEVRFSSKPGSTSMCFTCSRAYTNTPWVMMHVYHRSWCSGYCTSLVLKQTRVLSQPFPSDQKSVCIITVSRGSPVSTVSDYGLEDRGSIPDRGRGSSASKPALGPAQPPVQWVPGVLSPVVKRDRGVMLTTHPHLVPRLRMSRNHTSSLPRCLHGV
jgi:hypothetical protein